MLTLCQFMLFAGFSGPQQQWREYHYQRITEKDSGLSSDTIQAIEQDFLGFMWFGTDSGLNRYDGREVTLFSYDGEKSNSLSGNFVTTLLSDSRGFLWIGTFKSGLNRLDPKRLIFTRYRTGSKGENHLTNDRISCLAEGLQGAIWVGTLQGLNRLNPETGEIRRFQADPGNPKSLADGAVTALGVDQNGVLWVGTRLGLQTYNAITDQFQWVSSPLETLQKPASQSICCMEELEQGAFWVATFRNGMFSIHPNQMLESDSLSGADFGVAAPRISSLLGDRKGTLWMGLYEEGLRRLDPENGTLSAPLSAPEDPMGLNKKPITCLFEDRGGAIWVGTADRGIYRFHPGSLSFNHHRIGDIWSEGGENRVTALVPVSTGDLWVGSGNGSLYAINRNTNAMKLTYQSGKQSDTVQCLLQDRNGFIWSGLRRGGLIRVAPQSGEITHFLHRENHPNSLSHNGISALLEDDGGRIWIGTRSGLNRYDPTEETIGRLEPVSGQTHPLGNRVVYSLAKDRKGNVWVGSSHGQVYRLGPHEGNVKEFTISTRTAFDEFDYRVTAICQGEPGQMLVGTMGDGLKRIDVETAQVQEIPSIHRDVMGIIRDKEGHFWVSGTRGLSRLNAQGRQVTVFRSEDGLQGIRFSEGAAAQSAEGELFFGGRNGYNTFFPDEVQGDNDPPRILFRNFLAFDQPVVQGPEETKTLLDVLNRPGNFRLTHRQDTVNFEFFGLHFSDPEKVRFQYKLAPMDQHWQPISTGQRRLTFYNLGPGNYRLTLRAISPNQVWPPTSRALNFEISSPPWRRPWAYGLYVGLAVLALTLWTRHRTATLSRRAQNLENQVRVRTGEILQQKETIEALLNRQKNLFANVSHEFRTPLTLIMGPVEHMLKVAAGKTKAQLRLVRRSAQQLLRMVDQLLDLARLGDHQQSPARRLEVNASLTYLIHCFYALLEKRNLKLVSNMPAPLWIDIHPDTFEKIAVNLLSNAIKYSHEGGTIEVATWAVDGKVHMHFRDEGIGIPRDQQELVFQRFTRLDGALESGAPGAGIGLSLVRELTLANKGSIQLQSELGKGSSFTLTFPLADPPETGGSDPSAKHGSQWIDLEMASLSTAPTEREPFPQNHQEGSNSILIIEDHQPMRTYIASDLADHYTCLTAANGKEGLDLALHQVPDLIISDVMMPGMNGFEICHALKTHETTSHIPVILLTARGDRESLLTGVRQGADAYLVKPFDADELRYRISNLLAVREIMKKRLAQDLIYRAEASPTEDPDLQPLDRAFLEKFTAVLNEHYADPTLGLAELTGFMAMSERALQRKLKALTDMTPSQYLRAHRLKMAVIMLKQGVKTSRVAFDVGFSSHSYFTACFKAQYGSPPSEYPVHSQEKRT